MLKIKKTAEVMDIIINNSFFRFKKESIEYVAISELIHTVKDVQALESSLQFLLKSLMDKETALTNPASFSEMLSLLNKRTYDLQSDLIKDYIKEHPYLEQGIKYAYSKFGLFKINILTELIEYLVSLNFKWTTTGNIIGWGLTTTWSFLITPNEQYLDLLMTQRINCKPEHIFQVIVSLEDILQHLEENTFGLSTIKNTPNSPIISIPLNTRISIVRYYDKPGVLLEYTTPD